MAITRVGNNVYHGLTTDVKPTTATVGARFYETDNNYTEWFYDGFSWIQKESIDNDIFYENFGSGTYSFALNGNSPNGKWTNRFLGGGTSGVRTVTVNGKPLNVMWLKPQTSVTIGETHSCQNYPAGQLFQDFEMTVRMRTVQQLRIGSTPKNWETAWIVYRIGSIIGQINYYFVIKVSGSEFGKSDNIDNSNFNVALKTPATPSITIGNWQLVKLRANGNRHQVWVDGVSVIDYTDSDPSIAPSASRMLQRGGFIGLYCEDAEVEFSDVRIVPIYQKTLLDYEQSVHNQTPLPSSNRKYGAFSAVGATAGDGIFNGNLGQSSNTNAQVIDDLGIHWSYTTDASGTGQAGIHSTVNIFRRSNNVIVRAKIKNPSTITSTAFWFGLSSDTTVATTSDPLNAKDGLFVGYRGDNSNVWVILGNNAQTNDTLTTEGYPVTASKWVNLYLEFQACGQCIIQINNRNPVKITTATKIPSPSTNLYLYCHTQSLSANARTLTIDYVDMETSPGIDL
jgi:hypothetical protein